MRRLAIGRRLVAYARRLLTDADAACCCEPPSPCDKVYHRYDPCPNEPFQWHSECQGSVRTTPVYMRCDVRCPIGCGATAGLTTPKGIKFREWCHTRDTTATYYDPADFPPPTTPPPGAVPLPAGAEVVTTPQWCLDGVTPPCSSLCCKCWRWYCGDPCPCLGTTTPKRCIQGNQSFHDTRRDHKCVVGSCTELDSPTGYDEPPPGSEQITGADPGTCCENCGDCVDCNTASGNYQFESDRQCYGQSTIVSIDYDCCCSYDDTGIDWAYESVRRYAVCGDEESSVARGRAFSRAGEPVTMHVLQTVKRRRNQDGSGGGTEYYDHFVQLVGGCSPLSNLAGLEAATGNIHGFIGSSVSAAVSSNCAVALKNTNLVACANPDGTPGPCTGSTLSTILSVTHTGGNRTSLCRAGCRERSGNGPNVKRRLPTTLDILG